MSIRPTSNGSRSAGQQQQQQQRRERQRQQQQQHQQQQQEPDPDADLEQSPLQSYYIIGEHRYSWERALGSQSGAGPSMYSHDPRIALFAASTSTSSSLSSSSSSGNNNQPNNLNSPHLQLHSHSQYHSQFQSHSQSHSHSHSHSHYYPSTNARIVAGSNNFNLRSRNTRNILGQQSQQQRNQPQHVVPLNVRATAGSTTAMPPHSEHSVRGTTNGTGAVNPSAGSTQLRDIGRKYPLWLPEYKRRAFNVRLNSPKPTKYLYNFIYIYHLILTYCLHKLFAIAGLHG